LLALRAGIAKIPCSRVLKLRILNYPKTRFSYFLGFRIRTRFVVFEYEYEYEMRPKRTTSKLAPRAGIAKIPRSRLGLVMLKSLAYGRVALVDTG
jgi:hypothetical protein